MRFCRVWEEHSFISTEGVSALGVASVVVLQIDDWPIKENQIYH